MGLTIPIPLLNMVQFLPLSSKEFLFLDFGPKTEPDGISIIFKILESSSMSFKTFDWGVKTPGNKYNIPEKIVISEN